jgi:hypothetical protein
MRDVARWSSSYRNDLLLAAHSILRYTLLDKLMDAVGLPRHPCFKVIGRSAKPEMSEKFTKASSLFHFIRSFMTLSQLYKSLKDWSQPIKKLRNICQRIMITEHAQAVDGVSAVALQQQLSSSIPIFAVTLPENLTPAQKEVETSLRMLYRATANFESSEINQILLNMELLAYAFTWFGQVCEESLHKIYVKPDTRCACRATLTSTLSSQLGWRHCKGGSYLSHKLRCTYA